MALAPAESAAANKRPITETDLLQFQWIGDPQMSPDGSQIVFVRVTVNEDKDRYETSLYTVPADGDHLPHPFTSGPFDTSPRWSPDGRTIAFVRMTEKDGKPGKPQIYIIPANGGEARALTSIVQGAASPRWSPDGGIIAFTTAALPSDTTKEDPKKSDVRVITRAVYRSNGGGYDEPDRHSHIWTVSSALESGKLAKPVQLTSGSFDEENITWSPDSKRIYFTSTRVLEPYYAPSDADLYFVPAQGGEMVRVASIDGEIDAFQPSPDGKQIAFVGTLNGSPVRSYNQSDFFVTATAPESTPRNLTAEYDFDIAAGVSGDQRAPRGGRGGGIAWSRDGKSVMVVTTAKGRSNLARFRLSDGRMETFSNGDNDVIAISTSADASSIAALISTPTNIGDLWVTDARKKAAAWKRVTRINDVLLFSSLEIPAPEEIWYDSFDGKKINGWILKPPGFDASKKYPMILQVHGGPHIPYGYSFTHEFLWMAAKGYVVLYTNPRGSSSYGQEFGNLIQFAYPGDDYKDLMAGVDYMVARGYVDEKKIGITGGSGGGVLTNWAITQTDRFAAAVSQRSIADWSGFWYTCDFSLFQPVWFRGAPWEEPEDFAARSAINFVDKVTTPLMLIEGESDLRTPPSDGGEQMFRALKYLKKPVVMVRFPEETHELSRSGKPSHRIERLRHIVGWFDKYLLGQDSGAYEVR